MGLILDNRAGRIFDDQPRILIEGLSNARIAVRRIVLRNKDGSDMGFKLHLVYSDETHDEVEIEEEDGSIPANDTWQWGLLGAVMIIRAGQRLECVLDSDPTTPVEFIIDFGIST